MRLNYNIGSITKQRLVRLPRSKCLRQLQKNTSTNIKHTIIRSTADISFVLEDKQLLQQFRVSTRNTPRKHMLFSLEK